MRHILQAFFVMIFLMLDVFAATRPKVLTPEEAFKIEASRSDLGVTIKITLGEGIYLYDDKIKLELIKPKLLSLDTLVSRPKPQQYDEYRVQHDSFEMVIPQDLLEKELKKGLFTLKLSYQGCSKLGICYQPMSNEFSFSVDKTQEDQAFLSEQDKIAQLLEQKNIFVTLAMFFGFGLLLSLTPCVFPMIPILSSIIFAQPSANMSTKRGFLLSLVYVLSMALAYSIAGVLAGLFGANLQASLQNPWVISIFSAMFVLLALSMFGFYEIKIPLWLQTKVTKTSDGALQSKGILGVAIMGFLSALIVGPCVAAPLAGALIYIGQSGDALLGAIALFVMSLGMGVPLLIIGTTAGKLMPKPGKWMQAISTFFGITLLGVAIWMLSRIMDGTVTMALWTILGISSAMYAGAIEPLRVDASGWEKLFKSFAFMLLAYSVVLGIGLLSGSTNPLNPLEKFLSTNSASTPQMKRSFKPVSDMDNLTKELQQADKIVMLDFYADWCVNCIEFEKFTFSDERVKEKLQKMTLLKADVTHNRPEDKAMQKAFNIYGPPAILFFKNGQEMSEFRLIGFKNADAFLAHLEQLGI